jgi:tetratricopeptide (TPR) repeat protein
VALTAWNATRSAALAEARAAYDRGDLVSALSRALDHLDRRPWSRDAALLAGRCLSEKAYPDLAESYYRKAEAAGPLGLDDLQVRGLGLVRAIRFDQAARVYEEILRRWPNDPTALRRLATIYYTQQRMDQALALAKRLSVVPEGAVPGYALIGTVHHDDAARAEAIAAYEKVLELDPELKSMPLPTAIFWDELTKDLIATGRAPEARRILAAAQARRDDDAELHYVRGTVEEALGAVDTAEMSWLRALEIAPNHLRAWRALGRFELKRGRLDEALRRLTRASELDPNDYETAYSLSLALRRSGRAEEANAVAKRAEELRAKAKPSRHGMGAS